MTRKYSNRELSKYKRYLYKNVSELLKKRFLLCMLFFISLPLLVGCSASLNSDFDCKMKPGVVCRSLDQVNTMVDRGELGKEGGGCTSGKCGVSAYKVGSKKENFSTPYPGGVAIPGEPIRYGESVIRVWVAPYEDESNNYHAANIIYTVVKKGHWISTPPKSFIED